MLLLITYMCRLIYDKWLINQYEMGRIVSYYLGSYLASSV